MSRIADIYRRISESGRTEVFVYLRPQAEVAAEWQASVAAGGPLAGVVLAVKDNVDVAELPTTAACPGYAYVPEHDAAAVGALRAAGAVVIGKTNLDQFATGLVGTRSPYGAVRDSARPEHISGGSSSGSAVAVALDFADIAIGTDTAGSGRVPAGLQGIVGIKATVDIVSTEGVVPACESYDCVTIFARDLPTAERAMATMALGAADRAWPSGMAFAAPARARVAIPAELPALDDQWRAAFDRAVRELAARDIEVIPIDFSPFLAAARLLYDGALVAERWAAVGEFIGAADASAQVDPTVGAIVSGGARFAASDLVRDRRRVAQLRSEALALLHGCDALMVPTAPAHPTIVEVEADPVGVNSRLGTYTNFCNLFDMSAIAIPAGTVDEGGRGIARFGITLLAPAFGDAVVADLARALLGLDRAQPSWPERAGSPSRELAVFGAHLRGQPLEYQLTGLGARWAGAVRTAPNYCLKALDTTPPKPGLLRVESGGAQIDGERWVLSPAALGAFLADLPAPMMLGSVELDDGRRITGFGCDHAAGLGGVDITVHGGWLAAHAAVAAQ